MNRIELPHPVADGDAAAHDLVAPPGWHLHRLLDAPHRLAFSAAALLLAATGAWWAAVQAAIALGVAVRWAVPPAIAHGLPMTFGFLPLFFAGFQFTAGPKWLRVAAVPADRLVSPVLAQLAGWGVFALAVHGRDAAFGAAVGAIGLAAVAAGQAVIGWRFASLVRASAADDRLHARLFVLASTIGVGALAVATVALAASQFALVREAMLAGLWGGAGLTFAAATHRMIPFFSGSGFERLDARWPDAGLVALVAVMLFEAVAVGVDVAAGTGATRATWAVDWLVARGVLESVSGLALLVAAARWAIVKGLRVRLLAMMHAGLVWLGLSLVLGGVSQALRLASGDALSLGLAPLHAFTMGFIGAIFLGMVTRVTVGHGGAPDGNPQAADAWLWRLFLALQAAVLLRVAAACLEGALRQPAHALVAAAAIGWAGVCIAWVRRYGPGYGRPRPDGRRG